MNDITALTQRMEGVDPRDAFEKLFPLPVFCIRCGTGYASTSFNGWEANKHQARWEGWKAAMALMESRTVTVKLPLESLPKTERFWSVIFDLLYQTSRKDSDNWNVSLAFSEAKVFAAWLNEVMPFRGAGIQVIEGEGQHGGNCE